MRRLQQITTALFVLLLLAILAPVEVVRAGPACPPGTYAAVAFFAVEVSYGKMYKGSQSVCRNGTLEATFGTTSGTLSLIATTEAKGSAVVYAPLWWYDPAYIFFSASTSSATLKVWGVQGTTGSSSVTAEPSSVAVDGKFVNNIPEKRVYREGRGSVTFGGQRTDEYYMYRASFTGGASANFSIIAPKLGNVTLWLYAGAMGAWNTSSSSPSPPPGSPSNLPAYTLSVKAWVANASSVAGRLSISGTVAGVLSMPPNPTDPLQRSLSAGSSYSVTAPQNFTAYLVTSEFAVSSSWSGGSGDYMSQKSYTGTYNVTYEWSFKEEVQYQVWLYACKGGNCRQLYYVYGAGRGGRATLKNVVLDGERLRAVAKGWYIDWYFDPVSGLWVTREVFIGGSLSVTVWNSTPATAYFRYWQTPSGRVYSATITGTLGSDTQLIAVYSLSNRAQELLLLPGMDFQPSNGTHFLPITPGTYIIDTNATVILLDLNKTKLHAIKGIKTVMKVHSPYGRLAKVGLRFGEARRASQSLPVVVLDNKEYYLFSLIAPDQANTTVYLRLNTTTLLYKVVSPRVEVVGIEYTEDRARIIFHAWPSWDNYNVSVILGERLLSSSPASTGVLEIEYEKLQNVTHPIEVELRASWGGLLKALGKTLKLWLVPVAPRLSFQAGEKAITLSASEPFVLGEDTPLRQKLTALNEAYTPGRLCLRVTSHDLTLWKACSAYPYRLEVPYCSARSCTLEVAYVPAGTKGVIVVPWIEKLLLSP